MFCTVIIPTIGHDSLARAVHSVLYQEFPGQEIEIIIVNDSGDAAAVANWQGVDRLRIITTNRRERSISRNTGAAAKGTYLWFLDDDGWMLPGALQEFEALAAKAPKADWLYGGIRIVDDAGAVIADRNSGLNDVCFAQIMGGAWAPLQSFMIRADAFFKVGGFKPVIGLRSSAHTIARHSQQQKSQPSMETRCQAITCEDSATRCLQERCCLAYVKIARHVSFIVA